MSTSASTCMSIYLCMYVYIYICIYVCGWYLQVASGNFGLFEFAEKPQNTEWEMELTNMKCLYFLGFSGGTNQSSVSSLEILQTSCFLLLELRTSPKCHIVPEDTTDIHVFASIEREESSSCLWLVSRAMTLQPTCGSLACVYCCLQMLQQAMHPAACASHSKLQPGKDRYARTFPEWVPGEKLIALLWRRLWSFRWHILSLFLLGNPAENLPPQIHCIRRLQKLTISSWRASGPAFT